MKKILEMSRRIFDSASAEGDKSPPSAWRERTLDGSPVYDGAKMSLVSTQTRDLFIKGAGQLRMYVQRRGAAARRALERLRERAHVLRTLDSACNRHRFGIHFCPVGGFLIRSDARPPLQLALFADNGDLFWSAVERRHTERISLQTRRAKQSSTC